MLENDSEMMDNDFETHQKALKQMYDEWTNKQSMRECIDAVKFSYNNNESIKSLKDSLVYERNRVDGLLEKLDKEKQNADYRLNLLIMAYGVLRNAFWIMYNQHQTGQKILFSSPFNDIPAVKMADDLTQKSR